MKKLSTILVLIIVTACCGGLIEQVRAEPWPPLACQTAADFDYMHWGWSTICSYNLQMIEWDGEWWPDPDDQWTIATPPPQTDEPTPTRIAETAALNTATATDTTEEVQYHLRT